MNLLLHKLKVRSLIKKRSKLRKQYKQLRSEESNSTVRDEILSEEMHEIGMLDDEIDSMESEYLIEEARKLLLPLPDKDEENTYWCSSRFTGLYQLNRNGMHELRNRVREERSAKRQWMIAAGATLTGIIGAISGLVAVWKD